MKKIHCIILLIFILNVNLFSQNKDINTLADEAIKSFTWDIQRTEKGALMFLDVPYKQDNKNELEYLSITIAKSKYKNRPDFISVIIPNNIVQSNGILIKFAKSVKLKNGERSIDLGKENPSRINFEKCGKADCTARIIDGYVFDKRNGKKEDIYQKFFEYDFVLFLFVCSDGSNKSISVPLFSFKKQYETLL